MLHAHTAKSCDRIKHKNVFRCLDLQTAFVISYNTFSKIYPATTVSTQIIKTVPFWESNNVSPPFGGYGFLVVLYVVWLLYSHRFKQIFRNGLLYVLGLSLVSYVISNGTPSLWRYNWEFLLVYLKSYSVHIWYRTLNLYQNPFRLLSLFPRRMKMCVSEMENENWISAQCHWELATIKNLFPDSSKTLTISQSMLG